MLLCQPGGKPRFLFSIAKKTRPAARRTELKLWTMPSQTYLNFPDDEKRGKDCISRKERQGDGPRPVIPSECEGSKKDFSPVEYVANGDLTLRVVIPRGRNDRESFFASLACLAR